MFKPTNFPVIKEIWSLVRKRRILKRHKDVGDFWQPIIESYVQKSVRTYKVSKNKNFDSERIIWQYWGQGVTEDLPEVVKICFDSVDRYKGDWTVIRLDDSSIKDYVGFPDFVIEKLQKGVFSKTFFSDLLRVALLKLYGGVWLDATVLLTDLLPQKFANLDYFVFQRIDTEVNKVFWEKSYAYYWNWDKRFKVNMLSSVFFAKKDAVVVTALLDLMLYYWDSEENLRDYFVFQILYDELINGALSPYKCEIVSDVTPHLLQTKFNMTNYHISFEDILLKSSIHKMSYFDDRALEVFKNFMESRV